MSTRLHLQVPNPALNLHLDSTPDNFIPRMNCTKYCQVSQHGAMICPESVTFGGTLGARPCCSGVGSMQIVMGCGDPDSSRMLLPQEQMSSVVCTCTGTNDTALLTTSMPASYCPRLTTGNARLPGICPSRDRV
jgi:hypothetical protein